MGPHQDIVSQPDPGSKDRKEVMGETPSSLEGKCLPEIVGEERTEI